jgi:perosamine synthetase
MNRRRFLGTTAAASATLCSLSSLPGLGAEVTTPKPALLGGKPVRETGFPSWPIIKENDEKALMDVLHSGRWTRSYGGQVSNRFEEVYAKVTGAKHCIATANGTSALFASLGALDVGPGDEVILPPYTFVATLNVVLLHYALPIFVDTDPETFQIDAGKIEKAITPNTRALLPVHIGGNAADLDTILAVATRHKLPVVEDACQAHLAEWHGRKVGTWGDAGCFSFQASKNWNCGEGGAVICNDGDLAERVFAFHNNSRPRNREGFNYGLQGNRGANLRLTEFQTTLLLSQMERVEAQTRQRTENANYLTSMLKEIPGIQPAKMYEGCTVNAYHLYMFRYSPEAFAGLSRARFLRALGAEGIPCMAGYTPLNKESVTTATLKTRAYQKIYPTEVLKNWEERNRCPVNDKLCTEAVWLAQTMFIGPRSDMDSIAEAIRRIHAHAAELAKG